MYNAVRRVLAVSLALAAVAALSACVPEPGPSASGPSASVTTATPAPTSASPTPSATALGPDDIALPASCDVIYSTAMRATLDAQNPPLNDPGVTMNATQTVPALELLASGIPTIRCSWGTPSESGLATNVSIIDPAAGQGLVQSLQELGFGCSDLDGGTLCTLERTTIDQDDQQVTIGETHYLRGNGWVTTSWIDFDPDGYTEDIVATLWA